jgi:hypothetical protein
MVHGGKLSDAYWNPPPTRHKIVWTMRNEDMFVLRWGQPDFVRAFVQNHRKDYVGGAIIGSECYVPARLHHGARPAQELALCVRAAMALLHGVGTPAVRRGNA